MKVSRLQDGVAALVRSSHIIASMAQAVEELVLNCIDAQATAVEVSVAVERYFFEVRDNGHGIVQGDLDMLGRGCATSKLQTLEQLSDITTHGFRGEALNSICQLGSVDIVTRSGESPLTYVKRMFHGHTQPTARSDTHRDVGTTVTVRDFFRNTPVRRRQLVVSASRELEKIRQSLQRIALVHPQVSITLYDASSGAQLLKTRQFRTLQASFQQLFGLTEGLNDVSHAYKDFRIRGLISQPNCGHHNKDLQFLYVNKRSVEAKQIFKLINRSYLQLSFHALEMAEPAEQSKTSHDRDSKMVFNRFPIFLLDIESPPSEYDITFDPAKSVIEFKNWNEVLKAVALALKDSWVTEVQPPNEDQKESVSSSVRSLPFYGLGGILSPSSVSSRDQRLEGPAIQPSERANRELVKENSSRLEPKQRITRYTSTIVKQTLRASKREAPILSIISANTPKDAVPITVEKSAFSGMRVINQIDCKFILSRAGNVLYILDQHAIDERIGLEKLEGDTWDINGEPKNAKMQQFDSELLVPPDEAVLLLRHKDMIEAWGWRFSVQPPSTSKDNQEDTASVKIWIHAVPLVLGVPLSSADHLKEYIQQLRITRGARVTKPRAIVRLLQSKACRGAIMFGDRLTLEQCAALVVNVSRCELPFQCAHGRPSIVPLADLELLSVPKKANPKMAPSPRKWWTMPHCSVTRNHSV